MAKSKYLGETIYGHFAYYLSPTKRKIGIATALMGISLSTYGVIKTMKEVSKLEENLISSVDATYEGKSESRLSGGKKVSLTWPLIYCGLGMAMALGGAVVAATEEKDTTSQLRKDISNLPSFADKESIKRGDYTVNYVPRKKD